MFNSTNYRFYSIQQIPQQAPPEEPKKGANEHSTSHSPPSASSSTASSKEVAATHHGHVKKPLTYYFTWTGIKSLGPKIKEAAKHYWVGTKLFVFELRTATRIVRSVLNGHKLTRRERRQLKRTMMDLLRLVPFSVFVIVPFAEFLLPICLKIFPNMLPSTFEDKLKKVTQFIFVFGRLSSYFTIGRVHEEEAYCKNRNCKVSSRVYRGLCIGQENSRKARTQLLRLHGEGNFYKFIR